MVIKDWFCKQQKRFPNNPCSKPDYKINKLVKAKVTVYDCNYKSINNCIEGGSTKEVLFSLEERRSVTSVEFAVLPGAEPFAIGKYIIEIGNDTLEGEFPTVSVMKQGEKFITHYYLPLG